jgi:hypothetical protein
VLDQVSFGADRYGFVQFGSVQFSSRFVRSEGSGFERSAIDV